MKSLAAFLWRWRWPVAGVLVIAAIAASYLHRFREAARIDEQLTHAEAALAAREYETALQFLATYLESKPDNARARLLAARAERRLRRYEEAAASLDRCRRDGGDPEAIDVETALIAVERGDFSQVLALRARVALKEDDLSLAALEVLIQHDLNLYRLRDALQGYNVYLARRTGDLHALIGRGMLWERLLSFADAVADYRSAVEAHPESDQARRLLAQALLVVGTPTEALAQYRRLAEKYPSDATIKLGLAKCHRQLNRPEEARALLDDILVSNLDHLYSTPAYAEVFWERGQIEMDRDRPAEAEPWLVRADKAAPFDRRIVFSYFSCLQALKRAAQAETVKKRLEQIESDLRQLDDIRHRVMTNPTDAALRVEGGKIFLRNGERDEGIRWLELALRFDPGRDDARAALAAARASP